MRKAEGHHYLEVLEGMHRELIPDWYLEIGTQAGRSLALSRSNSVAIDPEFRLKQDVLKGKCRILLMQQTSDQFFESGFLENSGIVFDLAFLDGMHLYEFLLRDFINTERFMATGGRIVMHDCMPWTPNMANRDRSTVETRAWTGDVWKIVPILRKYRPDLTLRLYDAAPTGLLVAEGIDPANNVLNDRYEDIRQAFDGELDCETYVNGFKVTATSKCPWIINAGEADLR